MSEKILAQPVRAVQNRSAIFSLLRRLHFYIGLFIAPFIFTASLTGTLYVLTPQLEDALYSHQLFTASRGPAKPLSDQVSVAQEYIGTEAVITAVRPAPAAGETTRIMFTTARSGPSETTAVFIDPVSLEVRGILDVYGTSGVLPLRTWLDYLHRNLLLGELGRNYSELAASWLWVAALGGLLLWATNRAPRRPKKENRSRGQRILRRRYWHSTLGLTLLLGLLFFSATGLTWSRWAGENIALLRTHYGWMTPVLNTELTPLRQVDHPSATDQHAEHKMTGMTMPEESALAVHISPSQFDRVAEAARAAGINAGKIEIRPARQANKAWTVSEIDRRWPTQADSVAVDPRSFNVVDKVEFTQFGLLAKLTRWGVDAHMGVLFGLPNQLILAAFGTGLCVMIAIGYRLWWLRRPATGQGTHPAETLLHNWRQLSRLVQCLLLVCGLLLALGLPVMGISLLVLLLIDVVRWRRAIKTPT